MINLLPLPWRIGLAIAGVAVVLGGLGGAYLYVRHQGYTDGYSQAKAECADEKQKMETANENAINAAASKLADTEAELDQKEADLDEQVQQIADAASSDPHGGDVCLSADSVRALNAIK